jgi:hypothetical protein
MPYFPKMFTLAKETKIYIPLKDIKMTNINRFLQDKEARKLLWIAMKIPTDIEFPILPNEMLYGYLSDRTHLPRTMEVIFISNLAEKNYKDFFVYLASSYKLSSEEFSEEEASFFAAVGRK